MKNKTQPIAIVTGGGSGIGMAIAETFVKNKVKTIIIGRDAKKLKAVQAKLGKDCEIQSFDLKESSVYRSCTLTPKVTPRPRS